MNEIPIIILTAKGEVVDIIPGLDVGADNYVTKHFSPKVLEASIMAVLRTEAGNSAHWKKEKYTVIVKDNLKIAPVRHEVKIEGVAVNVTATEFSILKLLARKASWVLAWMHLIDTVKGMHIR